WLGRVGSIITERRTLGCVVSPYSSSIHISALLIPSVNLKSNPCTKFASVVRTILSPRPYPGHLLLPDPKGNSAKLLPNISTSLPKNLSGKNFSGSSQARGSRPMLHSGERVEPQCLLDDGLNVGQSGEVVLLDPSVFPDYPVELVFSPLHCVGIRVLCKPQQHIHHVFLRRPLLSHTIINHVTKEPVDLPLKTLHLLNVPLKIKKIEPRHPITDIHHTTQKEPLVQKPLQLVERHTRPLEDFLAHEHAACGRESHDGLARLGKQSGDEIGPLVRPHVLERVEALGVENLREVDFTGLSPLWAVWGPRHVRETYFPADSGGREAKTASWVLRNCLAMSGDEATTTGDFPNFRSISSPYFRDREWRDMCGTGPMRWRLPITGHGFGPGGSLGLGLRVVEMKAVVAMQRKASSAQKGSIFFGYFSCEKILWS
ncbi:SPla/RYanodine receptor (SPRY) domain-containing protein, partial [Striga asiatica]